ncbi:S41 family peptidase [Pseudomonadota bacterium]
MLKKFFSLFVIASTVYLIFLTDIKKINSGSEGELGRNLSIEKKTEYIVADSQKISFFNLPFRQENNEEYEKLLNDAVRKIRIGYVEEVEDKKLIESAVNGMLTSLDPHSAYLTPEDFKEMQVQTKGEFGGLGIEITNENSMIKVISPIEGTPAYNAGIKSGDYVIDVDGESIIGFSTTEAVKKMRGKPGTRVKIKILREGEKEPLEFKIVRGIINIKAVRGHREGDVIYLRINSFTEKTHLNLSKEITKIKKQIGKDKTRGLVLDLRNNPGGLLDEAIFVSDIFLGKEKVVVSVKGRNENDQQVYKTKQDETSIKGIPMVVLINEGSASASEIVAGALQDHDRAIVMGKKSFGKGSVQSVIPMSGGGAIKMTVARYYTPLGRSIQAEGIQPDIEIDNAKIEIIENKWITSEASLKGHLESDVKKSKQKTSKYSSYDKDLYKKDYQLARAIDLLMGVSIYHDIGIENIITE